jgi:hypothetical protein
MSKAKELLALVHEEEVTADQLASRLNFWYKQGHKKDWDMGDLDDIVDPYLQDNSGTMTDQVRKLPPEKVKELADKLQQWVNAKQNEFYPYSEIEQGDYVDFGPYGKLYVNQVNGKRSRVTDRKEDRFDPDAPGWYIDLRDAVRIIQAAADLDDEAYEKKLSSKDRKALADSDFVFPKERKYPIPDIAHARNALARVAQNGTPSQVKAVHAAVYKKFPSLKKGN